MCLACGEGVGEEEAVAESFDEVLAALGVGGGEAGEDFPGFLAAFGFVAAGKFAGDDRGAQGASESTGPPQCGQPVSSTST